MSDNIRVGDLKCDTPNCGYYMKCNRSEYPQLINFPCPKCGASLLTQKDYNTVVAMEKFMAIWDKLFWWLPKKQYSVQMNGTGKIKMKENKNV